MNQQIVIDADSHVIEPPDLWTSRMSSKHADDVPRVDLHPDTGHRHWRIGSTWVHAEGFFSQAGWGEYPPSSPWELHETDPAGFDPRRRLERMDEYGITAQVQYPNIIGFLSTLFLQMEPALALECTRVYNDFVTEWCAADRSRLVPIGMIPFWDLDAAVAEVRRCADLGHPGILFANKFEKVGFPSFVDPYWDPVYAAANDLDLTVNYHVGFSAPDLAFRFSAENLMNWRSDPVSWRRPRVLETTISLVSQYEVLGALLTSGLCDRFPDLRFVSVESGFGYVPFLLETLDWHWRTNGTFLHAPTLPSEYFRRQCYGTFWFEQNSLPLLEQLPDNFMFSTDFPHPTSLSPGPASPASVPSDHVARAFRNVPREVAEKALSTNAMRLYRISC